MTDDQFQALLARLAPAPANPAPAAMVAGVASVQWWTK